MNIAINKREREVSERLERRSIDLVKTIRIISIMSYICHRSWRRRREQEDILISVPSLCLLTFLFSVSPSLCLQILSLFIFDVFIVFILSSVSCPIWKIKFYVS